MSARARKRADASKKSVGRGNVNGNSRKDLVLDHLLNAAAELFLERGYANTRMEDIAASMQMSRSSLYYYYENKEQVLLALTESDLQVATDTLERLLDNTSISWSDKLRGWIEGNIREKLAGGARFRLVDRVPPDIPSTASKNSRSRHRGYRRRGARRRISDNRSENYCVCRHRHVELDGLVVFAARPKFSRRDRSLHDRFGDAGRPEGYDKRTSPT
jgi:AcrR family transcriptional regulator